MTSREFANKIANGKKDFLQEFIDLLDRSSISYCVIGGLAVIAYAEPVVSLDLDLIIASADRDQLVRSLPKEYSVKQEKHSLNISAPFSDIRVQLQTDPRYQEFIKRSSRTTVLGYTLSVASIEDVLQGKLWAYSDPQRRASKRQKDLADIMRLIESNPDLLKSEAGRAAQSIIDRI